MITIKTQHQDLDEALQAARPGCTIELQPGRTYYTRGPWQFRENGHLSLPEGCILIASGATIVLMNAETIASSGPRVDRDLPILWAGPNTRIVGGTWDCNAGGHPDYFTQGIRFFGKFDIEAATIWHMSGTREARNTKHPVESFAISSEGKTGGSSVIGCTVESSGGDNFNDYVSGIFVGETIPSPEKSVVKMCSVKLGQYGQFAYSCNGLTEFHICTGEASRGFYNDTGDTRAILISCSLKGHYAAISMVGTRNCIREVGVVGGNLLGERVVEWREGPMARMDGMVSIMNTACDGKYLSAIDCRPGRPPVMFTQCKISGEARNFAVSGSPKAIVLPCE